MIDRGLTVSTRQSDVAVTITDDAKTAIGVLSEGYPHFIQQFAYSAFNHDTNNIIELDDVIDGVYAEHGALHNLEFSTLKISTTDCDPTGTARC